MLKYKIRYIEYNGRVDDLVFEFEEKRKLLSTFLSSDVTPFEDWIKADFDKVLSGRSEYEEVNGNVCSAEIGPVTTKIFDNLIEEDEEYYATCCEVDTRELRHLIDEWCDKVREFKKEHHN